MYKNSIWQVLLILIFHSDNNHFDKNLTKSYDKFIHVYALIRNLHQKNLKHFIWKYNVLMNYHYVVIYVVYLWIIFNLAIVVT